MKIMNSLAAGVVVATACFYSGRIIQRYNCEFLEFLTSTSSFASNYFGPAHKETERKKGQPTPPFRELNEKFALHCILAPIAEESLLTAPITYLLPTLAPVAKPTIFSTMHLINSFPVHIQRRQLLFTLILGIGTQCAYSKSGVIGAILLHSGYNYQAILEVYPSLRPEARNLSE